MTHGSPDKSILEKARTTSVPVIPGTLLFFILKQLEMSRHDERLQQGHVHGW